VGMRRPAKGGRLLRVAILFLLAALLSCTVVLIVAAMRTSDGRDQLRTLAALIASGAGVATVTVAVKRSATKP